MTDDRQAIELQRRIRNYQNLAEKEQMGLLMDLGGHFKRVFPANVDESLIVATGRLLNGMYNDFQEQIYLPSVSDSILDTLSIASAMVREIKKKNNERSEAFEKRVKRLGAALISLADSMPHAKR